MRVIKRAVQVSTVVLFSATVAPAGVLDYYYSFAFEDPNTNSDVVTGELGFSSNAVGTRAPGSVEVIDSTGLGGEGFYDVNGGEGGFTFDALKSISESSYTVRKDEGNVIYTLTFESETNPNNYILSCSQVNDFVFALGGGCADNQFNSRGGEGFNVRFEQILEETPPAVPLPAGLPLLLAGLAAFAGFRVRRSAT